LCIDTVKLFVITRNSWGKGERHEDAISLFQTVGLPRDVLTAKSKQLSRLLGIKNAAEYEERLMDEDDAKEAVRDAERFFSWVKEFLSK
jgi:hypothetical protein